MESLWGIADLSILGFGPLNLVVCVGVAVWQASRVHRTIKRRAKVVHGQFDLAQF